MRIAVIETKFLEDHVRRILNGIKLPGEVNFYNYENFSSVGPLYASICLNYDGFLVSGPLPLTAIKRYVGKPQKPIVSFGSDAIGYYETFFKAQYEQKDMFFEKGYFDLLDMSPQRFSISWALRDGSFWTRMNECYKFTARYGMGDFLSLEAKLAKKHIASYRNGNTSYSVTRLSSIMPLLLDAGIPVYFVWPSAYVLQSAVSELIKNIHIANMVKAQNDLMRVSYDSALTADEPAFSEPVPANRSSALDLSLRSGISANTIKKVLKAIETAGTNRFTSKALAAAMDLNVRSANRLLAKLTERGLAEIISEQMRSHKGRPERVYHIFKDYLQL